MPETPVEQKVRACPPVALIVFNRPEPTARVFEAIRAARPGRLFVIADGPRADQPGEAEQVAAARAVTEAVDWPCEATRLYSETNLGCGVRPATGITAVFEAVEDAVILEDDCVPHPSFFRYCADLLDRYRHDERVMTVSGSNFQRGMRRGDGSYYFSRYPHTWGWATWRRAWRHYDFGASAWPAARDAGVLQATCGDPSEAAFWTEKMKSVHAGLRQDVWDYQWVLACWAQHGLAVIPNINLISNVGDGAAATHTNRRSWVMRQPVGDGGPTVHPKIVVPDFAADELTGVLFFAAKRHRGVGSPVRRAIRRIIGAARWDRFPPPDGGGQVPGNATSRRLPNAEARNAK